MQYKQRQYQRPDDSEVNLLTDGIFPLLDKEPGNHHSYNPDCQNIPIPHKQMKLKVKQYIPILQSCEILEPCKWLPFPKILRIILVRVCLLLKGYTPIWCITDEASDEPLCDVPCIEECQWAERPPSKSCKIEDDRLDCSNDSHFNLLSAMNLLMPLICLVKDTSLSYKDEGPDTHGFITIKRYYAVPDYDHGFYFIISIYLSSSLLT